MEIRILGSVSLVVWYGFTSDWDSVACIRHVNGFLDGAKLPLRERQDARIVTTSRSTGPPRKQMHDQIPCVTEQASGKPITPQLDFEDSRSGPKAAQRQTSNASLRSRIERDVS